MKNKEGQIARYNVTKLMNGEFDIKKINKKKIKLNTTIWYYKNRRRKILIDKIIDALNDKTDDQFYIEHLLAREDWR